MSLPITPYRFFVKELRDLIPELPGSRIDKKEYCNEE
jgi:hypothetical protein